MEKYEKIIPDKEFLDESIEQYDKCADDVEMFFQDGHFTEKQTIDLLNRLDEVQEATKEDMRKGVFFFSMWVYYFLAQSTITKIKNGVKNERR